MVEMMIAVAISLVVLWIVWDMFVSGRRGMARGEAKLEDLAESNTVFLLMKRDLHTSVAPPQIVGGRILVVQRYHASTADSSLTTQVVSYTRVEGLAPGDAYLLRRIDSGAAPDEDRERKLCSRTLKAFGVSTRDVAGQKAVEVELTFISPQDASETLFRRVFTPRQGDFDRTWRPLAP